MPGTRKQNRERRPNLITLLNEALVGEVPDDLKRARVARISFGTITTWLSDGDTTDADVAAAVAELVTDDHPAGAGK